MAILTVHAGGGGDYTTHAAAFAAASANDTIRTIDSATYNEQVPIPALDGLTWDTDTGCTPTVTHGAASTVTVADGATNLSIVGIAIVNTAANYCVEFLGDSTGFSLSDCNLEATTGYALGGGAYAPGFDIGLYDSTIIAHKAILAANLANVDIRRCTSTVTSAFLHSNDWKGIVDRCTITLTADAFLTSSIAASGTYSGAVTWSNCLIVDEATATATGVLPIWDTVSSYNILGCTIVGTSAWAAANITMVWMDVQVANLPNVAIAGNIITGFLTGLRSNYATYTDDYNDVWGNGTDYGPNTAAGAHSISSDPLFVGGGDYHPVAATSPTVGASADLGLTEDLDGNPRPDGLARYWIGAYNLSGASPDVTGASASGSSIVTVSFSDAMTGADLTNASAYSLVNYLTSAAVTVVSVAVGPGATTVILTVATMESSTLYRVTVPATITSTGGGLINNRIADFVTAVWGVSESANPWAASATGETVDLGTGSLELLSWDAGASSSTPLEQLLWISLFTDRAAEPGDTLPDDGADPVYRGGWWGDTYADDGRKIGSRLWLLRNQPITDELAVKAKAYADEALAWLVEDGVVARVVTTAQRIGTNALGIGVTLYDRAGNQTANLWLDDLWEVYRNG